MTFDMQRLIPYTQWTRLRGIGNSTPAKLTILIPIIGYLIIFNENVLAYLELSRALFGHHRTHANEAANVSPRLLSLYFGLCFIAIASAIYSWKCPWVIKKYASAPEFIGGDGQNFSVHALCSVSKLLRVRHIEDEGFTTFCQELERQSENDPRFLDNYRNSNSEIEANGLTRYFIALNQQSRTSRYFVASFYLIGLIFMTAPSIDVFFKVLWALIHSIRAVITS